MKIEKREITLNERDTLKDMLFFEKGLLREYVSSMEKAERKETRTLLETRMGETAEEIFLLRDLLSTLLKI